MVKGGKELTYTDVGESPLEAAGREEWQHFRQDLLNDFTDPTEVMSTQPGKNRRTTVMSRSPIDGGPDYTDGRQIGWYIVYDVTTGEHKLVSIQSTGELADLPQDALAAEIYINLLVQENESLAAQLFSFLREDAITHTTHHTSGADVGKRNQLIFSRAQLDQLQYQDHKVGEGIVVPPIRHRAKHPSAVVGPDSVEW